MHGDWNDRPVKFIVYICLRALCVLSYHISYSLSHSTTSTFVRRMHFFTVTFTMTFTVMMFTVSFTVMMTLYMIIVAVQVIWKMWSKIGWPTSKAVRIIFIVVVEIWIIILKYKFRSINIQNTVHILIL
jgi:hypothetical protein